MTGFLVFDTETTGLPVKNARYTNLEGFSKCRVLSVAIVQYTEEGVECGHYYRLVKSPGVEVAATEIHGITQEQVDREGISPEQLYTDVLEMFYPPQGVRTRNHVRRCGARVVGHNVKFDVAALRSEFHRLGLDTGFMDEVEWVCTHLLTKKILFTSMKLEKLYNFLFHETFEGAHNALNDCRATGRVFMALSQDPRTYAPIASKKVWIKVSDVATITGVSYFKKPQEIIENLWARYNPSTFRGLTQEQICERAVENAPPDVRELFQTLEVGTDPQDSLLKARSIIKSHPTLTDEEKIIILPYLQKTIYTTHGITQEDEVVKDVAEYVTDDVFYKHLVCTIEGTEYYICGRVDRVEMCDDGTTNLIEIKNRTKGLFNKVRDYENIQVQMYLHLNKNWNKARLLEHYNGESKGYLIERDTDLVETTLHRVHEFCKTLHYYMSS